MSRHESVEAGFRQRLAEVRSAYARRASVEAGLVARLSTRLADPAAREALRELAHRTRGTAGTLGFAEISSVAGELEDAVNGGLQEETVRALARSLESLMTNAGRD